MGRPFHLAAIAAAGVLIVSAGRPRGLLAAGAGGQMAQASPSDGTTLRPTPTPQEIAAAESAIRHADQAIRANPKNSYAYAERAGAFEALGDYDKAIRDFTTAIKIDGKIASHYIGRAYIFEHKRDYTSAINDFSEAIRLQPKQTGGYLGRGLALQRRRNTPAHWPISTRWSSSIRKRRSASPIAVSRSP